MFSLVRLYFLNKKAPTVPRCRTETKFNVWLGGEKYKKTCPLEIERLQTLPDNYTEFGMDESGNVKAMRLIYVAFMKWKGMELNNDRYSM